MTKHLLFMHRRHFVTNLQETKLDNKRQTETEFFPVSWTSASEALRIYEEFYIQILKF